MTTLNEPLHPGAFIVSESEGQYHTREAVVIAASQVILAGQVLGKLTNDGAWDAASAAKSGGNTGNGTLTLATPKTATGRQVGVYQVRKKRDTFAVGAPAFSGTGNGALTRASPAFSASAQVGTYIARLIEAGADAGSFEVIRPDGTIDGIAAVGVAYDGQVKFTIADGATDFSGAAQFTLAVTAAVTANAGDFTVTDPHGVALADASVGVAYTTQIKFTIADGSTDFIVGDGFDVTVTQAGASGQYGALDLSSTAGLQNAVALAVYPLTTTADAAPIAAIVRGPCEYRAADIAWPAGITTDQIAAAAAQLSALGIVAR